MPDERPWPSGFFKTPLVDLGDSDGRFRGVWTPETEIGAERIGISDQFLANAEDYHQRYSGSDHMRAVLAQAFDLVGLDDSAPLDVLDVGTGSGVNSLVPMLSLFARGRFIATDLSPDLLRILEGYVVREHLQDRVGCICTDAMRNHFRPSSFDLVTGVSILHHLIDPSVAIRAAYSALKAGGVAVFTEPFEGYATIGVVFRLILERADRESLDLDPVAVGLMRRMIRDFDARRGVDKSAPHFRYMDDKWLFTRKYLEDVGREAGFSSVTVLPHANHATFFRDYTANLLRLGDDLTADALPAWAWEMFDLFDRSFSPEMKYALLMEGSIILEK